MGYEVDFLPVATGGAAISVRWGWPGNYKVLVYDGGTALSGERLVAHIETQYMCSKVDYVVSSHPARDHAAGLGVVLRNLRVGELWMHRPWAASERPYRDLGAAYALEQMARARRIPVREPFAGATIGPFTVLSPRQDCYVDALLPAFGARPASCGPAACGGVAALTALMRSSGRWLRRWWQESLREDAATSAENESSAVLYGDFDGRGVLLTGRAGPRGLHAAADHAELLGIDLPTRLRLIQLPNQGNPEHVSMSVLDRIVGRCTPGKAPVYTKSAFVSVGLDARDDAGRVVAQALRMRGAASYMTRGVSLHHAHEMPYRGWYRAKPCCPEVEA